MKPRLINLIWGLALIVAGVLFLGQNFGFLSTVQPLVWVGFFTVLSLLFFVTYFIAGLRAWGWLMPAMVFGALALTVGLAGLAHVNSSALGSPILGAIAVPFIVAFLSEPKKNQWALIPAWVMLVLTIITILADRVPGNGEVIGSLVLWSIGLPFMVVYAINRTRWWALIPGGIMTVLGFVPLLTIDGIPDTLMGPVVMFLFSLPFLVVFFLSVRNWWSLIPAGLFLSIGVAALIAGDQNPDPTRASLILGILFLGWGLTFFILWARRRISPTGWAIYPAGGMVVLAAAGFAFGAKQVAVVWPLVIILIGLVVLYSALRRRSL